eukprot:1160010-Pelagomonas_calceolata.AAC.10
MISHIPVPWRCKAYARQPTGKRHKTTRFDAAFYTKRQSATHQVLGGARLVLVHPQLALGWEGKQSRKKEIV